MESQVPPLQSTLAPLTVGQLLGFLAPSLRVDEGPPAWPPDVFAVVCSLLQRSGGYTKVVSAWPPPEFTDDPVGWAENIEEIADTWRKGWSQQSAPPAEVRGWWSTLLAQRNLPVAEVADHGDLCDALLQACAAADEACAGVGIPSGDVPDSDPFEMHARERLEKDSTLCDLIHKSRVCVLPKLHTPQNGITLRSLSHNLALCNTRDVRLQWVTAPMTTEAVGLNLLLLPWPEIVTPGQFRESRPALGSLFNMPDSFRFFHYDVSSKEIVSRARATYRKATEVVGRIDGVVCPELSMNASEYEGLRDAVVGSGAFLVCGVRHPAPTSDDLGGRNCVCIAMPVGRDSFVELTQDKHHRWRLDKSQIIQYGLGSRLSPECFWWEDIPVGDRRLGFVAIQPWLTICALVCEDLARQDPVAELLRAVGPNLVVSILMDGPQLSSRWPARYATVLADDPGSSVLTLTSVGMAELSHPPHSQRTSRVVALWKDAGTGDPVEIELPQDCEAVVLSVAVEYREEWAADGRSDGGVTGYPILAGVHPIAK